ncbi:hypothetical protein DUI87_32830 [Hirundo rustica rustica]|uniref:Uncharacterized protein n=1 Tax=Hirundo rustica rustica TaxID=333673 RepID=A0A3M0IPN9_HIRRU|nr:hypothetical protein DUI87_32830 [Hirundo rustica rustica]
MVLVSQRELCMALGTVVQTEPRSVRARLSRKQEHGRVQVVATGYGADDEAVAQEGSQGDAQEEAEVQELQLPCVCQCQQKEVADGVAAVGHLLWLHIGTCSWIKDSDKSAEACFEPNLGHSL